MKPLLIEKCGFSPEGVTVLTDKAARREAIQLAFERLKAEARPEDTVVIHFSGHSVPSNSPQVFGENDVEQVYLIVYDTQRREGALVNGISAPDLHAWMQAIPAGHKTLILDTHASFELVDLARREGSYALILASDTAEVAYEWEIELNGQVAGGQAGEGEEQRAGERVPCGLLTGALYQAISQAPDPHLLTYREWMRPAIQVAAQASTAEPNRPLQTPYFVGLAERRAFGGEDPYWDAFELVLRGPRPGQTLLETMRRYTLFRLETPAPHPAAHAAFGRIFLEHNDGERARQAFLAVQALSSAAPSEVGPQTVPGALPEAPPPAPPVDPQLALYLGLAELLRGDLPAAQAQLSGIQDALDASLRTPLATLLERLPQLKQPGLQATFLLPVGDYYESEDAPLYHEQIDALERVLRQRLGPGWVGTPPEQALGVNVLYGPEHLARPGVLAALEQAQAAARSGRPALLCWLDADLDFANPGTDKRARFRSAGEEWLDQGVLEAIVRDTPGLFIWVQTHAAVGGGDSIDDLMMLVECLLELDAGKTTSVEFEQNLKVGAAGVSQDFMHKTFCFYSQGDRPVFVDPAAWEAAVAIKALLNAPIHSLIEFLQEVIARREGQDDLWPDGRLCQGVAYAAVGEYEPARRRLEEVIEICENGGRNWNKNVAMAL